MAKDAERYVRWQDYRNQQFGFANNLFLTFSVAALAYGMSLLTNETFKLTKLNSETFHWALLILAFSSAVGALVVLTRLWDFRLTAKIVRRGGDPDDRKVAVSLGRISWIFFQAQVISCAFGVERLGRSIFDAYAYRLM